jgi:hypothetical protein
MEHWLARRTVLQALVQASCYFAIDAAISPLLGDGSSVDWWFAYKLNTANFPECSTKRQCIFGGEVQDYPTGYSLQYLLASGLNGKTSRLALHTDCLGSGDDPVAKTFAQIFDGNAPNYVIWSDQFYGDPIPNIKPPCGKDCLAPWGHSKGALAWDSNGVGFVLQVSTPDWPGNGDKSRSRESQGNTLGCIVDDDAKVAQHFFALRLGNANDTQVVLEALGRASVATDPTNSELVKLSDGPPGLASLAKSLGNVDAATSSYDAILSVSSVSLIAKPYSLAVPPWQLVSSILQQPLRVASWWATPKILSAKAGTPGCWDKSLAEPKEVQIAISGQWSGKVMGMKGSSSPNGNHAKIGHSLGGSLSVFGDMNQEGSYQPADGSCQLHQNGRGGLFFALSDDILHDSIQELLAGDTASYYGDGPPPSPGPSPSPPTPTPPSPGPPEPHDDPCGGANIRSATCRASQVKGCVYVYAKDAMKCGVSFYGCYSKAKLAGGCPEKTNVSKKMIFMI